MTNLYVIEKLSIVSIIKVQTLIRKNDSNGVKAILYYIKPSSNTNVLLKLYEYIFSDTIHEFSFKFEKVIDDESSTYGLKKIHKNIGEFWGVLCNREFPKYEVDLCHSMFAKYFMKNTLDEWPSYGKEEPINKLLLMLYAIKNYSDDSGIINQKYFIIEKRLWMNELIKYASNIGVELIAVKPKNKLSIHKLKNIIKGNRWLTTIYYNIIYFHNFLIHSLQYFSNKTSSSKNFKHDIQIDGPAIIVDQVMQFLGIGPFGENHVFKKKKLNICK